MVAQKSTRPDQFETFRPKRIVSASKASPYPTVAWRRKLIILAVDNLKQDSFRDDTTRRT